ncbi:eukaryotic translation initiation factor 3 subunit D-like [Schistocerca gregaria]|uniref:eukaryotic translation initiation factor 3 subunit D-like n=1 Tax=Schistocerca gregaria TaxID=7010 RepID=UPI00211DB0D1|nr:eukaryotic translation initiation factor 3 subunit D-like [Schistocerca gregaria]
MVFQLPSVHENATGWGPPATADKTLLPEFLRDLPLQPYTKSERSSRISDWTTASSAHGSEEEAEFQLVDHKAPNRKPLTRFRRQIYNRPRVGPGQSRTGYSGQHNSNLNRNRGNAGNKGMRHVGRRYANDHRRYEPSISINPEWGDPIELFEFVKLQKIPIGNCMFPTNCTTLLDCGQVGYFNTDLLKRVTTKSELALKREYAREMTFLKPTSSDDPNLHKFAEQREGNVFMIDTILSMLMTMHRSLYSWDLIITKKDGQLWLDKSSSRFDSISVNENASDLPDTSELEALNAPAKLSQEAMFVQNNFSQQVLIDQKLHKFQYTSPYSSEANTTHIAPVGYRYLRMPISPELALVVRAEFDAVMPSHSGGLSTLLVRTLNEYDVKITGDWRKKLENQPGCVLATELKNNMFKIQRWIIQTLIAGCERVVLGFISRQKPKDTTNHSILAIETYKPKEIIHQMNMNLDHMWAVLCHILQCIWKHPDGKYLLFKEPSASCVKLYKITASSSADSREAQNASPAPSPSPQA